MYYGLSSIGKKIVSSSIVSNVIGTLMSGSSGSLLLKHKTPGYVPIAKPVESKTTSMGVIEPVAVVPESGETETQGMSAAEQLPVGDSYIDQSNDALP